MAKALRRPRAPAVPEGSHSAPRPGKPDPVIAIREIGRAGEHAIPAGSATFTIGASRRCDLVIDHQRASPVHCTLTRRRHELWLTDTASHHGTFVRGHRVSSFVLLPGETFEVAGIAFVALSEGMRLARLALAEVLGYSHDAAVDRALLHCAHDGALVIVGPRGAGHALVARAIHDASVRPERPLLEIPVLPSTARKQKQLVASARGGTLVLTALDGSVGDELVELVASPEARVRLMVLARSLPAASKWLDRTLIGMNEVEIRPLRYRWSEIEELLDAQFARSGVDLRMSDLTPPNRKALCDHDWPDNLDEVRETAACIGAIVRDSSIRKAARALGVPRSTVQYRLRQCGVRLPFTDHPFLPD